MADDVIPFRPKDRGTWGAVSVERVLAGAQGWTDVLLLGVDDQGKFVAAHSSGDRAQAIYWCELFKAKLLGGEEPFDNE